ncbi:hypothetical protein L2E82_50148 [Cichorium intybus]|nr:hypothetical protein L2E82_50148 [Cichorium intybus]
MEIIYCFGLDDHEEVAMTKQPMFLSALILLVKCLLDEIRCNMLHVSRETHRPISSLGKQFLFIFLLLLSPPFSNIQAQNRRAT